MTTVLTLTLLMSSSAFADQSFLEEALFAGGARDAADLQRLVALYHQRIDPMVELVKDSNPQIAAQLLLKHLHVSYGGTTAVLKEYRLGAYSLKEALDTGVYNCLSATMLFTLAARQAGLDVTGEWYTDHARAVLRADNREFQVEPTRATGFNVDDWYLTTRTAGLKVEVVVATPRGRGMDGLLQGAWAWAGEPRDARWASRVTPSPPPLVSAFSVADLQRVSVAASYSP